MRALPQIVGAGLKRSTFRVTHSDQRGIRKTADGTRRPGQPTRRSGNCFSTPPNPGWNDRFGAAALANENCSVQNCLAMKIG